MTAGQAGAGGVRRGRTAYPSLAEARALAPGNTLVPISIEIFADRKTPVEALRAVSAGGREAYLLESAPDGDNWGRYTFIGYDPVMEVSARGGTVTIREGGASKERAAAPHAVLKELVSACKSPRIDGLPPFTGGFVGYFAYDYIRHIEPTLRLSDADPIGSDDYRLLRFDKVVAFDHLRQKIFLIVNIAADKIEQSYAAGLETLLGMERLVLSAPPPASQPVPPQGLAASEFTASFERAAFCAAVEKAKRYIFEGDIFQCVPSIRFSAAYRGDLLAAYRVLRTTNPSAYMFYLRFSDMEIAGASPETLVTLKDGIVHTCPIAGTCKRTDDDDETNRLVESLLADEKELAEHDMLVDLGRNDIGKVSEFGSVRVDEYRSVKRLSHVCHLASKVSGKVAAAVDAPDVMAALLPAGTLSGAPKKRACEIIDELEGARRGVYGGAIGYIDFAGNMDLCIAIRMAVCKDGIVHVQAGAGIVADSEPEREYEECVRKAGAMIEALKQAGAADGVGVEVTL
ncbi:MAG: anthranilate synthase component I family protein [Clostridiales bacterium]|jgi:anthranilate synthase component 1|nr:anthranilate synthase component I family protein [Clostridiales bacterium]